MQLFRLSIRRQLLLACAVIFCPLIAALAWSGTRTYGEAESEISDQATEVASTAAAYLDEYFVSLDALASAIVKHPAVVSLDEEQCDTFFADLLRSQPLLINIVLTAPDGTLHGSGLTVASGSPIDMTHMSFREQTVRTGRPQVSELITGQVSHKPTVVFTYPVFGSGHRVVGVVGLGVNLVQLETVFRRIPLQQGSIVSLFDRGGRVLARSADADRYIGTPSAPGLDALSKVLRPAVHTDPDGIDRVTATATVARGPWTLSVAIPHAVVLGHLASMWRRNVSITAGVILLIFAFGTVVAWQTTVQLAKLHAAAQRIANGDLSPPLQTVMPNLEFAQLQDAFTTMAGNLREAREALGAQMEQQRQMNESLTSLQKQVVQQERLAAVGLLVSGVAHELNNPLQGIVGATELLERHASIDPDMAEDLELLKTQGRRMRDIVRNLARFSAPNSGPPSLVDLRAVVSEVFKLRERELDLASIQFDIVATTGRRVLANFTELEQVALNFVVNAQHAVEDARVGRGRILVRVLDRGDYVRCEVHDNGHGVNPADEAKLFQPFFTTKAVGKGTGLGLSVSYGIITSYEGRIAYTSNEWNGATFFFELKAADADGASPPSDDRASVLPRSV